MTSRTTRAGLMLAMLAASPCPAFAAAAAPASAAIAPPAQPVATSLVPQDFAVPASVQGAGFKLAPLGPELVKVDFAAYMSSIEHLQQTFTRSTGWPRRDISDAEAMLDMETERARFQRRESFAYAVLTADGSRERGSVYVRPSPVEGYDAVVSLWVTKAEYDAGFDAELYRWVVEWIGRDWPFRKVAYPGRAIPWGTWDALAAAKGASGAAE